MTEDADNQPSPGQHFMTWLAQGVRNHSLRMNDAKALVHTVDNTLFLVAPGLFQCYAQEHPYIARLAKQDKLPDWEWAQKHFEHLRQHRKQPNDLNIWTCNVSLLVGSSRKIGTSQPLAPLILNPSRVSEMMPIKVFGPPDQNFDVGNESPFHQRGGSDSPELNQDGPGIHFGTSLGAIAQGSPVNFSGQSPQAAPDQGAGTADNASASSLIDLVEKLLQALSQFLKQNQGSSDASPQGDSGSQHSVQPSTAATANAPATTPSTDTPPASPTPAPVAANPAAAQASSNTQALPNTAATDSAPTAGSGPYALNITNTQDHAIKIGQFDKNDDLVAELTLQPGQKGTMNYEKDTTGLLKQADSDGNFKPDASRLEFYNGFINTSDIDGRNASIHATDGKGFEIGDTQSIADKAPASIVSEDSAGNKTIAGDYDGSTDKMKQGAAFLTAELGTGMTYMHPDDDKLGQGQNPMRHTDSMSLDVTFGKA